MSALLSHLLAIGPQLGPIAPAGIRILVLVTIAMLLILVLLPAAVGAVGTQASTI